MKIVRVTIQCVMDVDTNKPVMVNLPADDSGRIIVTDRATGEELPFEVGSVSISHKEFNAA